MAAVVPILGGILTAGAKVVEFLVPPIKRQVDYMRCYSSNIKDLQHQIEKLEGMKEEVQHRVRVAENNSENIVPAVEKWIEKVLKIKDEADGLCGETTKVHEGCIKGRYLKLKSRYLHSRRAKKMSESVIQLQKEGKFRTVSYPPFPLGMMTCTDTQVEMGTASLQSEDELKSRESLEITSSPDPTIEMKSATLQSEDQLNLRKSWEIIRCSDPQVEMNNAPIQSEDKIKPKKALETKPVMVEFNKLRTRKAIEERIIATLLDSNVNIVSVCGMGGTGKTTMARIIGKKLREMKLFDAVVMADVTQRPDFRKIQHEIAEMLGLKLEEDNARARADRLRRRILGEKRILIILDDIWKWLSLYELGIPSGKATCKILLTSRARDVCVQMGAEEIELEVLSGEEAWILFSEIAGITNENNISDVYPIAKEVANECKGLPLALVSVARALKHKSKHSWEDALSQLQRFAPTNIPRVLRDVYQPLELSYTQLDDNEAQLLFLLCSLFREGSSISIEDLVRYGIGLTIFNGIISVREGRNRAHALVETLKDRFLLEDDHREGYVKMHNIVRAVAIAIASKDNLMLASYSDDVMGGWHWRNSYQNCTHISVFSHHQFLPTVKNCPKLVFLLWECENQEVGDPNNELNKFETLNVLHMNNMDIPASTSSSEPLKDLRTLQLHDCKLEDISFLGELIDLEILSFRGCYFKIFPARLGRLVNLRLLDLTDCEGLQIIERGAIAGMTQLEELYLPKHYAAWGLDSIGSASLSELEKLSNLTTLRILIADTKVVAGNLHLCNKLSEYNISIRAIPGSWMNPTPTTNIPYGYARSFQKAMDLFIPRITQLGEWIGALVQTSEDLRLTGDGSDIVVHKLDTGGFGFLKQLAIKDCSTVQQLATTKDKGPSSFAVFPKLETLYLYQLPNINKIFHGQLPARSFTQLRYMHFQALTGLTHISSGPTPNVSLSNLRSIYIHQCPNLKFLFSTSLAQSLLQLEELEIGDCVMMEEVVFDEGTKDRVKTSTIEFLNLSKLVLRCLHRVTTFITKIDRISFPQLTVLKMEDLPQLNGFCPAKSRPFAGADFKTLFTTKVAIQRIKTVSLRRLDGVSKVFGDQLPPGFFHELEFLELEDCNGLNFIFSSSIAGALLKLKRLIIKNCRKLVEVLEKENEAEKTTNTAPFCHTESPGLFHQLEYLKVDGCDSLKTLFPPSVAQGLVKLGELRIKNCDVLVEVIGDEEEHVLVNNDATPFPQLRYLKLRNLPNAKTFWNAKYDFEIPSLRDVISNTDRPLMEQLVKIAKNAKQMIEYQKKYGRRSGEPGSHSSTTPYGSCQGTSSTTTAYGSCQSYICSHKEE